MLSVLVIVQVFGQKDGDEQGLEAPEKFQLEADKEAVQKAYRGWWTKSQADYEERMDWYKKPSLVVLCIGELILSRAEYGMDIIWEDIRNI